MKVNEGNCKNISVLTTTIYDTSRKKHEPLSDYIAFWRHVDDGSNWFQAQETLATSCRVGPGSRVEAVCLLVKSPPFETVNLSEGYTSRYFNRLPKTIKTRDTLPHLWWHVLHLSLCCRVMVTRRTTLWRWWWDTAVPPITNRYIQQPWGWLKYTAA